MDSLIAAAARALGAGDALGALKHVSLREDPSALALRGIAMAQLGEYRRARELLRCAARKFGAREELGRARCVVAEAEVALAMRELAGSPRTLLAASATLAGHGDRSNALHARLTAVRRLLLLGRLDEAAAALARLDARFLPPPLLAVAELAAAEVALRSLRTAPARAALARAHDAALRSGVPALVAEVADARDALDRPAARRIRANYERPRHSDGVRMQAGWEQPLQPDEVRIQADREQPLRLDEVEALLASGALVVDGCRRGLRAGTIWRPLERRPVLFALARALAEGWPGDVDRNILIARAFHARRPNESHRARLRVEIGRLRALVAPLATIEATARGFSLTPKGEREVVVLAPPIDGDQASLLALLADGAAWSTSALALALGSSQRMVQRALVELEAAARVRSIGHARAKRWLAPSFAGFTTNLLLPITLPP